MSDRAFQPPDVAKSYPLIENGRVTEGEIVIVNPVTRRPGVGPANYTGSQFEDLFQQIREVVAEECEAEPQLLFVPIRRLIGLFKNARALAKKMRAERRGVTTIGLLEQALHAVDLMSFPRGTVQTNAATVEVTKDALE